MTTATGTLDPAEVDRFNRLASEWWDPTGKFKPLHQIGPARLRFIREQVISHFHHDRRAIRVLEGLSVLDIGCGGGLVSEPLAQLGGRVTGIDPGKVNIEIARSHAEREGVAIDYRIASAEELVAAGEAFDVVVCLEVIEHIPDVPAFSRTICKLVKTGRPRRRFDHQPNLEIVRARHRRRRVRVALAAARYPPVGPLRQAGRPLPQLRANGLAVGAVTGMVFNPLTDEWRLAGDTDVNYLVAAHRPA